MVTYAAIFLTLAILATVLAVGMGVLVVGAAAHNPTGQMEGGSLFVAPLLVAVVFWCLWAAQ